MSLRWSLDEIVLGKQTMFVRGWLWRDGAAVDQMHLLLIGSDGSERSRIKLLHSQPRPDVATAYPSEADNLNTGFVGLGSWRCQPSARDTIQIMVSFINSQEQRLDVTRMAGLETEGWKRYLAKWLQWRGLAQQSLMLLRRRDWSDLSHRIRRHIRQLRMQPLPSRSRWRGKLRTLPSDRPVHLIIDHDLGGGANAYRNNKLAEWQAEDAIAICLTFQISKLAYILSIRWRGQRLNYSTCDESQLLEALSDLRLSSIVFNNAVSFSEPTRIPALLTMLKQATQARLSILLHDYFSICPTIYLLDHEGKFCNIPHPSRCAECLASRHYLFATFYQGSICAWRACWGSLLQLADEIIAFSESSASLLRKAYPESDCWAAIQVRPHRLEDAAGPPLQHLSRRGLVIGVVGQIGVHKGAHVVRDLADQIHREAAPERIVVIGGLECQVNGEIVRQTGRYEKHELRRRIQESGANIMLFPSICPETFSHVCAELIQLDLPIACFDLGAQAERIRAYLKGTLLTSQDPSQILIELRELYKRIYEGEDSLESKNQQ